MNVSLKLAAAAAFGVGLACAGVASAQDFRSDFDEVRSNRAAEASALTLGFTLPFGRSADVGDQPSLSLNLMRHRSGETHTLNLMSFSLAGAAPHLEGPLTFNAADDGEGGWLSSTRNKILLGIGAGLVIWAIVEAEDDDDAPAQSGPQ
jgi:hypothetical protein